MVRGHASGSSFATAAGGTAGAGGWPVGAAALVVPGGGGRALKSEWLLEQPQARASDKERKGRQRRFIIRESETGRMGRVGSGGVTLELLAHFRAALVADFLPGFLLGVAEQLFDAVVGFLPDPAGFANEEKAVAVGGRDGEIAAHLAELFEFILQDRGNLLLLRGRQVQPRLLVGQQVQRDVVGGVHGAARVFRDVGSRWEVGRGRKELLGDRRFRRCRDGSGGS